MTCSPHKSVQVVASTRAQDSSHKATFRTSLYIDPPETLFLPLMYPKACSCEKHGCLNDHDPVDRAEDIVEGVVLPKYQLECPTNALTSLLSIVSWASRSLAESWHSGKTPSDSAEDLERTAKTGLQLRLGSMHKLP